MLWGFLVGAIISSTDAAAVFSILRAKNANLKGELKPLLEVESGSNDPMAVFLTISAIELLLDPAKGIMEIILMFIMQMGIGGIAGWGFGKLMVYFINSLKFSYDGLYPVFSLAICIVVYSLTTVVGGSGFLAVYIAGIIAGNSSFIQKKGTIRFFDGLAVLSQIAMFLTLGLLVFPSELLDIIWIGLLITVVLIFFARPLSVFVSLIPFKYNWKEKVFISWVGLRGAVPIILATFPLLAGIINADMIFNVVFFIVIISVLLQGWTINIAAGIFKLAVPGKKKRIMPLEFNPVDGVETELLDFIVPYNLEIAGKQIVELNFPPDSRIVLIWRNEKSIIPVGGTALEEGDTLLVLVNKNNIEKVKDIFRKYNR
jgi:cell volume regulation protein A